MYFDAFPNSISLINSAVLLWLLDNNILLWKCVWSRQQHKPAIPEVYFCTFPTVFLCFFNCISLLIQLYFSDYSIVFLWLFNCISLIIQLYFSCFGNVSGAGGCATSQPLHAKEPLYKTCTFTINKKNFKLKNIC